MTNTDALVDCIDALHTRPSGLCLRFPDGKSERLAMPSGKATLGAGAGCAVPIRYSGVEPLHCLLFPTSTGWRVRRWASGTLLNGGVFTEAAIEIGDRLQLGPVELEFVGDEPAPEMEPEQSFNSVAPQDFIEEEPTPVATSTDDISDFLPVVVESHETLERADFAQTIAEHADRLEELARQIAECVADEQTSKREVVEHRQQLEVLRNELAEFVGNDQTAQREVGELRQQLEGVRVELAEYVGNGQASQREGGELRQQLEDIRNELAGCIGNDQTAQREVAELRQLMEGIRTELAEYVGNDQTSHGEVGEFRQQLEDIRHELAHAEQLHVATREAVVELERQLTSQREAVAVVKPTRPKGLGLGRRIWPVGLRRRLVLHKLIPSPPAIGPATSAAAPVVISDAFEPVEETASEVIETPHEAEAVETPRLDWLNQIRDSVVDASESTEVSEATEVSEDTEVESDAQSDELFSPPEEEKEPFKEPESFLNRFQHLLKEEGDNSTLSPTSSVPARPLIEPTRPEPVVSHSQPVGGEDDSIEGYMAQLLQRMRGESHPSSAITSIPSNAIPLTPVPSPIESFKEVPAAPSVSLVTDIQEIKAAPAPERSHDMAALRHLANHSARHAISTANIRHHREHALTKVVVSVLAIICGLFVMRMSPSYTSPEFIGGLVPLFAGALWGTRTIVLLLKAIRAGSFLDGEEETQPEEVHVSADEL